jgi:hypothetical protein
MRNWWLGILVALAGCGGDDDSSNDEIAAQADAGVSGADAAPGGGGDGGEGPDDPYDMY